MPHELDVIANLNQLVLTRDKYDSLITAALPKLLDHATAQTRRFLRQVGQWKNDVFHERLASRWGYELIEHFIPLGRLELPCRPLWCLDGIMAQRFSQPEPFHYGEHLRSPLGRLVDGLMARAVVSRGALIMLFYHLYGCNASQVMKVLGLSRQESQRVYKSCERWRQGGWQRVIEQAELTQNELLDLASFQLRSPRQFQEEAERLIGIAQTHYRKSEPNHFPCLSPVQWHSLLQEGYGGEYRLWHLAFCSECMHYVTTSLHHDDKGDSKIDLVVRLGPVLNGRVAEYNSCYH